MNASAVPLAPAAAGFRLDHGYARLPEALFHRVPPEPVPAPALLLFNRPLARTLGLDPDFLESPDGVAILAGNALPPGAEPIAMAYAGHQFGHFTMLGDGRAVLLGEQIAPDGRRFDLQVKGSGRTAYSRSADGRAAIGPMLREYVISEAMAALGVPTTRSLAVVATGQPVRREALLPGAVLTRVAASHLRVGTVQYAAAIGDRALLEALVRYATDRHYPAAGGALGLLQSVVRAQADLVARWMLIGFVHGVMNTDNMALSGETIDYGPCAFMDGYAPDQVFSSIDHGGRYAYGEQPRVAQWNLARLAEGLLPLIDAVPEAAVEKANALLTGFTALYDAAWLTGMRAKLGLARAEDGDRALAEDLLVAMAQAEADWTLTFRTLDPTAAPDWLAGWHPRWTTRLAAEGTDSTTARARIAAASPAVIPRNHQVEAALTSATDGDLAPVRRLLDALAEPFASRPERNWLEAPPAADERVTATFCGT